MTYSLNEPQQNRQISTNILQWSQRYSIFNQKNYTYASAGIVLFLLTRLVWYSSRSEFSSSYLDEMLVIYLSPFAVFGIVALRRNAAAALCFFSFLIYFMIFIISGLVNWNTASRGANLYVYGITNEIKWAVLFLSLLYFSSRPQLLIKNVKPVLIALLVIALINSLPAIADMLSSGRSLYGKPLLRRGPLWLPQGLFQHQVASAHVSLFGYIASLCLTSKRKRTLNLIRLFLFAVVVAHGVSKEASAAVAVTGLYFFIVPNGLIRKGGIAAKIAVFSLLLAAVYFSLGDVFLDRISFYVSDDAEDSVRRLLYSGSMNVALDFFPWGTGPSSFASDGARTGLLSNLYNTYGIYGYWGANYANSNFLVDVFWPKILAESGAIGFIFYGAFIAVPGAVLIRNIRRLNEIGRFCLFVYISGLLSSLASPALNSEMYATIFYFAVAITLFKNNIVSALNSPDNTAAEMRHAIDRNGKYQKR